MMLDYPQLEKLIIVEKQGSIASAARFLNVSKSAVSQHVTGIEEKVGRPAIERSPTKLTPYGRKLCRLYELTQMLEAKLAMEHGHLFNTDLIEAAPIKTSYDDNLQCRCLMDALERYEDKQTAFRFDSLHVKDGTAISKMVRQETMSAISSNNSQHYGYRTHYLGEMACWAVASPDYIASNFPNGHNKSILMSADTAAYDIGNDLISRFLRERTGHPTHKVPSPHGVLNLYLNGSAWGMMPVYLAEIHISNGDLINIVPDEELYLPLYWHVINRIDELLPNVTQTIKIAAQSIGMRDGVPQSL